MTSDLSSYIHDILVNVSQPHHPVSHIWLGAMDLMTEGRWFWATSDIPVDGGGFSDWARGEPNNFHRSENCMDLVTTGSKRGWYDDSCDDKFSFICQKPLDSIVIGK